MSDEWIETSVKQIKEADKERRRRDELEMHRADKLGAHEGAMWKALVKSLKATAEKFNANFPYEGTKHLTFEDERSDSIAVVSGRDVSMRLSMDSELHSINYDVWDGNNKKVNEGTVPLGFTKDWEVCFIVESRPVSTEKLTQLLLDQLIKFYLES